MSDSPHGSAAPGPAAPTQDRRITDLILETMTARDATRGSPGKHAADPFRVGVNFSQDPSRGSPVSLGVVLHAVPHLNWYKVQTTEAGGFLGCCALRQTGALPMGVRSGTLIPPGSTVLLHKLPHLSFGVILGVLPPIIQTGKIKMPDWLVQGGQSGLQRERGHQQPLKGTVQAGGILDFSGGSALDATCMEASLTAETGVAFMLDPFQAFLRVNEACGLFLNYFDSYARLIGLNLDVMSGVHEESWRNDEGENQGFRGVSTYPWEALGLLAPGPTPHEVHSDKDVQSNRPVGKLDLPDATPGLRPFHRWREYDGYLGQGHVRLLVAPGDAVANDLAGGADAVGLFCEAVGLDGAYSLRTAKSYVVSKRCNVVAPRLVHEPENAAGDKKGGAYKFSSFYGTGADHVVGDLDAGTDNASLRKAAGVRDMLAHLFNWKVLHPFHYHSGDYAVPEESGAGFAAAAEPLDFDTLASSNYMRDPTPVRLRIDHRYDEVEYFQRESFIVLHEDGSVQLGCGFGARVLMTGGKLRLEAPGDLEIVVGNKVIALGRDVILRAANSCDVSADNGDVRLAAKRNMQLTAQGVLLDAKGGARAYDYANRVGEDVVSNGVVIRSAGDAVLMGHDLYLRSGANPGATNGGITLDAAGRDGYIIAEANEATVFTTSGFTVNHGGKDQPPTQVHSFGPDRVVLSTPVVVRGDVVVAGGGLTVEDTVSCAGDVVCGRRVADSTGGMIGKVPDGTRQRLRETTTGAQEATAATIDSAADVVADFIDDDWRSGDMPGGERMRADMLFSFRDDDDGVQYGVADLRFLEPRWQQLVRLGGGSGGVAWASDGLAYQGRVLQPWPGHAAWESRPTFLRADAPTLYDPATGNAAERSAAAYGEAAYAGFTNTTMSEGLKVIF